MFGAAIESEPGDAATQHGHDGRDTRVSSGYVQRELAALRPSEDRDALWIDRRVVPEAREGCENAFHGNFDELGIDARCSEVGQSQRYESFAPKCRGKVIRNAAFGTAKNDDRGLAIPGTYRFVHNA